MEDEFPRRPLASFEEDQRRLIAEFEAARGKRQDDERRRRDFLANNEAFCRMLTLHGADSEHLKQLALDAAAKQLTVYPLQASRLGILAANAADAALDQEKLEREGTITNELRRDGKKLLPADWTVKQEVQQQPDYFARKEPYIDRTAPKAEWLGKHQSFDPSIQHQRDPAVREGLARYASDPRESFDRGLADKRREAAITAGREVGQKEGSHWRVSPLGIAESLRRLVTAGTRAVVGLLGSIAGLFERAVMTPEAKAYEKAKDRAIRDAQPAREELREVDHVLAVQREQQLLTEKRQTVVESFRENASDLTRTRM